MILDELKAKARRWGWVALAVAALAAAAGLAQRCSPPARVEEKAKVEETARAEVKDRSEKATKVRKRRVTTIERRPDGGSTTTTVVDTARDEDLRLRLDGALESSSRAETRRVEERRRPDWRVRLQADWAVADLKAANLRPTLSLEGQRRLAGPLWAGARVTQDKQVGLTLSLEF